VIEPGQLTRSAITVAGMSGVSDTNARTLASNGVNDVGTAGRSYFGGPSEASARSTVALPIPNCCATRRRGTPSGTSRLINAQSSTEITHPICLGGLVFDRRYGLVSNVVDTSGARGVHLLLADSRPPAGWATLAPNRQDENLAAEPRAGNPLPTPDVPVAAQRDQNSNP